MSEFDWWAAYRSFAVCVWAAWDFLANASMKQPELIEQGQPFREAFFDMGRLFPDDAPDEYKFAFIIPSRQMLGLLDWATLAMHAKTASAFESAWARMMTAGGKFQPGDILCRAREVCFVASIGVRAT